MLGIIKHPEILQDITHIELLAPVSTFEKAKGFHTPDQGYLHGKNLIVREEYIQSLKSEGNILKEFLDVLKKNNFSGEVKLIIGIQDTIVSQSDFDISYLQSNYPFLTIQIQE